MEFKDSKEKNLENDILENKKTSDSETSNTTKN